MAPVRKKIGLFFGSFNPVHIGHMIIAQYMVEKTDLHQVWMVVSPQNPFKSKDSLAPDRERLHMIHLAIGNHTRIKASDIEFGLPIPSYTVDTLALLAEKYPDADFILLMGGDNLPTLPKWKNYDYLISNYNIYVYSRPGYELGPLADHPHVTIMDAPQMSISSTMIRDWIANKKSVKYLVPDALFEYIDGSNIYR